MVKRKEKWGLIDNSIAFLDRIKAAVSRWQFFSWNTRQKASVLQSYVMSKLWYYSFILDFNHVVPELNKLCKQFLWYNRWDGKVSKRTKVRQERTELSTSNGGLGLFHLPSRFQAQSIWIANMCFTRETKVGRIWECLYTFRPLREGPLTGHSHVIVQDRKSVV